jgi:hypothetical protein
MPDIHRRGFVQTVAAALPAASLACRTARRPPAPLLDRAVLDPLGRTVLPTELGTDGIDRILAGFQTWLAEYRPGAELNHGYGTGELAYAAESPASRWQRQLDALEREARERWQRPFAELSSDERREMVRRRIDGDRLNRLPTPSAARHVAVGLLSYFYSTPEATDLCYRAAIRKRQCRPLAGSPNEPVSLQRRGA